MPSTTTTTISTKPLTPARRRRPLTNTNTDELCATDSWLGKWIYRFNLWTGLYMLNPYERFIFHLVGWFAFTVSMLYLYVFWKGFVEGFHHGGGIFEPADAVLA
jgi:Small subunit of serine palmitoyltransferase-like